MVQNIGFDTVIRHIIIFITDHIDTLA